MWLKADDIRCPKYRSNREDLTNGDEYFLGLCVQGGCFGGIWKFLLQSIFPWVILLASKLTAASRSVMRFFYVLRLRMLDVGILFVFNWPSLHFRRRGGRFREA